MAKRQSPFEDLVEIAAKLPWKIGVALAVVSYLFMHWLAIREIPAASGLQGLSSSFGPMLVRTFAMFGQYLFPFALLLGAGISAYQRKRRSDLHFRASTAEDSDVLNDMTWAEFEMLVGESYRLQGFKVYETGGTQADGGVDLVLSKDDRTILVQCKQWRATKVSVTTVRELNGVVAKDGASGGVVITSGEFTKDAKEFAKGCDIELIDHKRLMGMLREAKQNREPFKDRVTELPIAPKCPLCSRSMVTRIAKKGPNAGGSFWGCFDYPRCRGIRPI